MSINYDHIKNSIIAVSIAEIVTLPICTIKTNHLVYNNKYLKTTIQNIYNTSGIKGFYYASIPAIISQVLSTTSKYTFYRYFTSLRNTNKDDILNNSINGMLGGILGGLIVHPVDVWKNYKQRNMSFYDDYKKKGYKLLYQGYSQNILKNVVLYSILFPTYDFYYSKTNNSVISSIGTSLTAGVITQPIDYLKIRFTAGIFDFKVKDLYKGFNINLMRTIPHFLITMNVMEKLNNIKKT